MKKLAALFATTALALPLLAQNATTAALVNPTPTADTAKTRLFADAFMLNGMSWADIEARRGAYTAEGHYLGNMGSRFEFAGTVDRDIGKKAGVFAGAYLDHRDGDKNNRLILGYEHDLWHGNIVEGWMDQSGHGRIAIGGDPQITKKLSLHWEGNTDRELNVFPVYKAGRHARLTAGYDSKFGFSAGAGWKF